jgi:hypothetical protein
MVVTLPVAGALASRRLFARYSYDISVAFSRSKNAAQRASSRERNVWPWQMVGMAGMLYSTLTLVFPSG